MNKQEQIEKMSEILHKDLGIGATAEITAKTLFLKGYINGADFVEFLKSQQELEPPYDDDCLCGYVDVDKLDEYLQEYLKGE